MFDLIDEKKSLLDKKRPLPINTVKSIRDSLLLDWTYKMGMVGQQGY